MPHRWNLASSAPAEFTAATDVASPVLAQLLWNRGLRTRAEVEEFLEPSWERHTHDAAQFRHMGAASARVFRALDEGQRITVHGDYDADGVTGSTVLITTLREIESRIAVSGDRRDTSLVDFYIPHRDKEGYGLHRATVPKLHERGTKLVITVDCGIACCEEIALARTYGLDVIVVDHHQFGETLPEAHLIHPGLPEEPYPFKKLAAVGVAFKFACALLDEARRRGLSIPAGWEKWLLDLVAIATVTDVVPLVGENRVLETYGLRVLNKTKRPGLRALIEASGLECGQLDTESVGFAIGPRINAAGRMEHAELALRLLLEENEDEARRLAQQVEACNRARQEATRLMMRAAEEKLVGSWELGAGSLPKAIVLWDERWSPALVGLVAGKLAERFGRPVVVVGAHEGQWIGSGRSIPDYDITAGMRVAGEGILTRVGGHAQACGFALRDHSQLGIIAERLRTHAAGVFHDQDLTPTIAIDMDIPLEAIDMPLAESLQLLAPFGEGNRRPMFVSRAVRVAAIAVMGTNKNHLRLTLITSRGRRIKALGFKMGERVLELAVGQALDIAYTVAINEWQGSRSVECRLVDFHVCI